MSDQHDQLKLIVDYDAELNTHYAIVMAGKETLLFRPGFRSREAALAFGDQWMKRYGFVVKGDK